MHASPSLGKGLSAAAATTASWHRRASVTGIEQGLWPPLMAGQVSSPTAASEQRNPRKPCVTGWRLLGGLEGPLGVETTHRRAAGIRKQTLNVSFPATNRRSRRSPLGRVEMWRGSSRLGLSVTRPFRLAVPKYPRRNPVSTSPSSNRTCRFPASGSRTRHHAFAHALSRPPKLARPKCPYRCESGYVPPLRRLSLYLLRNHRRNRVVV